MPAPKKFKDPLSKPPNPKAAKLPSPSGMTSLIKTPSGIPEQSTNTSIGATRKYNKDYLKDKWTRLSGRMMDWLDEGDRLEILMAETKLRDLGVMLGIATEKVLLLEGQPTQIIGQPQHQALDRLGLALKDALEKRGLVTLTERKVDIKLDGPK